MFFCVEAKSFERNVYDGVFTIVERGKGHPHKIGFPIQYLEKVLDFVDLVCKKDASEDLQRTIGFNGGSLFLSRKDNDFRSLSGCVNGNLRFETPL